jgi:hypothetical protein
MNLQELYSKDIQTTNEIVRVLYYNGVISNVLYWRKGTVMNFYSIIPTMGQTAKLQKIATNTIREVYFVNDLHISNPILMPVPQYKFDKGMVVYKDKIQHKVINRFYDDDKPFYVVQKAKETPFMVYETELTLTV